MPAPKITGTPGNLTIEKQDPVINYQFASADGVWRVNLTSKFISLACTNYTCWEDFAKKLDKPLVSFIKILRLSTSTPRVFLSSSAISFAVTEP